MPEESAIPRAVSGLGLWAISGFKPHNAGLTGHLTQRRHVAILPSITKSQHLHSIVFLASIYRLQGIPEEILSATYLFSADRL